MAMKTLITDVAKKIIKGNCEKKSNPSRSEVAPLVGGQDKTFTIAHAPLCSQKILPNLPRITSFYGDKYESIKDHTPSRETQKDQGN